MNDALHDNLRLIQRRRCSSPRRRAFTLIEVLATVALMAIALPVIMRAVSLSNGAASTARHRTDAAGLAESKLNELVATNAWQTGQLQGDFGDDYPDYQWSAEVQSWPDGAVQELDLHISWNDSRFGAQTYTLSTLVYPSNAASTAATGGSSTSGLTSSSGGTGGGL